VVEFNDIKNREQKTVGSVHAEEVAGEMLLTSKYNRPPATVGKIIEPKPKLWLILCLILLTVAFAIFFVLT
jgi:hypothetical protein